MKKLVVFIITLIALSIISFVIFTDANYRILKDDEALIIGEEMYLKFLWIVDGAFNDSRYEKSFKVNGKELSDEDKIICTYKNKKTCTIDNFEEYFKSIFISSITYDNVYSDGVSYSWYEKSGNEFNFTNMNTCNVNRMGTDHTLVIKSVTKNEITYQVTFKNSENYNNVEHEFDKEFVLAKEDGIWKVKRAYYHDLCHMDYNIG